MSSFTNASSILRSTTVSTVTQFITSSFLVSLPEPLPIWPQARLTWGWSWTLHVYGLAVLYLILNATSIIVFFRLSRSPQTRTLFRVMLMFTGGLASYKSIIMFLDPYHSTGIVRAPIVHLSQGLSFPCLVTVDTLLYRALTRLVRIRTTLIFGVSNHSQRVLYASIAVYFFLVIGIYLTVSVGTTAKHWIILIQMVFITWEFIMAFLLVLKCFKLARYCRRSKSALRHIILYTRQRRHLRRTDTSLGTMVSSTDVPARITSAPLIRIPKTRIDPDDRVLAGRSDLESEHTTSDEFTFSKNHRRKINLTQGKENSSKTKQFKLRSLIQCFHKSPLSRSYNVTSNANNTSVSSNDRISCQSKFCEIDCTNCGNNSASDTSLHSVNLNVSAAPRISEQCTYNVALSSSDTENHKIGENVYQHVELSHLPKDSFKNSRLKILNDDDDDSFLKESLFHGTTTTSTSKNRSIFNLYHSKRTRKPTTSCGGQYHVTKTNEAFEVESDFSSVDSIAQSHPANGSRDTGGQRLIDQFVERTNERERKVNIKRPLESERRDDGGNGYCFSSNIVEGKSGSNGGGADEETTLSFDRRGSDISLDGGDGPHQSECGIKNHRDDNYKRISERTNSRTDYVCTDSDGDDDFDDGDVRMMGYLADTEYGYIGEAVSAAKKSSKLKRRHRRIKNHLRNSVSFDNEFSTSEIMPNRPFALPVLGNGLGLYRILQGCVINSALPVIYIHVTCSFIICLTQIYAVFGVFGVLSNENVAAPWPWYTFQTVSRVSEVVFFFTLLVICRIVSCQLRSRVALRKRFKLRKRQEPSDVTCVQGSVRYHSKDKSLRYDS